jgi:hypothetical protein
MSNTFVQADDSIAVDFVTQFEFVDKNYTDDNHTSSEFFLDMSADYVFLATLYAQKSP